MDSQINEKQLDAKKTKQFACFVSLKKYFVIFRNFMHYFTVNFISYTSLFLHNITVKIILKAAFLVFLIIRDLPLSMCI